MCINIRYHPRTYACMNACVMMRCTGITCVITGDSHYAREQ